MYKDTNHIKSLLLKEYQRHISDHVFKRRIADQSTRDNPHDNRAIMVRERDVFVIKIVTVLISQGKKTRGDQVKSDDMSFSSFIEYPDYYLTMLDLWVLFNHFQIPVIFLSKTCMVETGTKQLIGFSKSVEHSDLLNERFIFIITTTTSPKKGKIPQYKIITCDGSITFSLNDFKDSSYKTDIVNAIKQKQHISQFIENFDPTDACKKA